jgi:hypothetical protein
MVSLVIGSSSARRPLYGVLQPSPLGLNPGFSLHECGPRNLIWSDIGHLSTWHTVLPRLWRCGLTCYSNARAQTGQHTCSRSPNPGEATLSPLQTRPLKRFEETRPRNVCLFPQRPAVPPSKVFIACKKWRKGAQLSPRSFGCAAAMSLR